MSSHVLARRLTGITAALGLALTAAVPAMAAGRPTTNPNTDGASSDGVDTSTVLVRLSKEPLATSTAVARIGSQKVDFTNVKTKNARAELARQRNDLRQWLKKNAPRARITGEFDVAVNAVAVQLNGTPIAVLQGGPGVVAVEYQGVYAPTDDDPDPDLALINALAGWVAAGATPAAGSPTTWAGFGIQIGVIDSGIDATHPCFADGGFPGTKQLGDTTLTNNKVIVAKVFNNKLNQSGYTAAALDSHGTHVAGTIACNLNTTAVVHGVTIPYTPSGVAPGAQLGNYNVFPGEVENARSEDILNALQAAYTDGMDVINMSLGGGSHGKQDLLTVAVDNLDRAGVVVAVSAGNEGPGYWTVDSPGMAERALTAGASSVGHVVALDLVIGSDSWPAAIGDFPVPESDLEAPLAVVLDGPGLGLACASLTADLSDRIALVSRGDCAFEDKVANAAAAGAEAVIVANNLPGDGPIVMAGSGTIPAVGVSYEDGQDLVERNGETLTIQAPTYRDSLPNNVLESFSSWGPTNVDFRVKPDVVAPGGNVLSSIPLHSCAGKSWVDDAGCWAFFSGTSMASPHLAGMAAVVLDAHDWAPWQVRSAIINTAAAEGVVNLADGTRTPITDVQQVGSGLAQLDAAVNATLVLSRPSISFGAVPSGSGKSLTQTFQVTNVSAAGVELDPVVTGELAALFTASAADRSLTAGETTTITVTLRAPSFKGAGFAQAHLRLDATTHAALFAFVK